MQNEPDQKASIGGAMRILHLITPSSRMMKTYVDVVQEAYPRDEHYFYATRNIPKGERDFFSAENMIHMEGSTRFQRMKHFKEACDNADVVVWHGFLYPFRMMLFLYLCKSILAKSAWVMWGIDLYNWKTSSRTPKALLMNHINRVCRKKVKVAIALLDPDVEVYKRQFRGGAKVVVAPYPISYRSFELMEERRGASPRRGGGVNIQIGNNAHSFNNHFRVLEDLQGKDRDNIQYYFPLSYGDSKDWGGNSKNYAKTLISHVSELYGERAHYLLRMMDQEEYTDYLWGIDVAIFDADRQNALGNILKLLYMGAKVYLSPDNPLYSFFKQHGIEVLSTRDISSMTQESFLASVDNVRAVEFVREMYYPPLGISRWSAVFDVFRSGVEPAASNADMLASFKGQVSHFAFKKGYLPVAPYASTKKKLPQDWHYAILHGAISSVCSAAQAVMDCEPNWYLAGVTAESGDLEFLHAALAPSLAIHEAKMLTERSLIVPVDFDWNSRKDALMRVYGAMRICNGEGKPLSLVSNSATVGFGCTFGFLSVVMPRSVVEPNVTTGISCILRDAVVGSFSVLGDYVTMMPGSVCGAGCQIGDGAFVDSGVVLPPETVVPAGAVITRTNGDA